MRTESDLHRYTAVTTRDLEASSGPWSGASEQVCLLLSAYTVTAYFSKLRIPNLREYIIS